MRSLVRELGFPILLGTAQNFKNKKEEVQEYGLSKWLNGKESACQGRRCGFDPWVGKIPWGRKWQPTPVFLPEKSHGQKSLVGESPQGCKESDITKHTHTHIRLCRVRCSRKAAEWIRHWRSESVVRRSSWIIS